MIYPSSTIINVRLSSINRVVIKLNKFNQLKELTLKQADILVLTKTKLDSCSPTFQLLVDVKKLMNDIWKITIPISLIVLSISLVYFSRCSQFY